MGVDKKRSKSAQPGSIADVPQGMTTTTSTSLSLGSNSNGAVVTRLGLAGVMVIPMAAAAYAVTKFSVAASPLAWLAIAVWAQVVGIV